MTKESDILVFIVRNDAQCSECAGKLPKCSFLRAETAKRCAWSVPT